MYIHRHWNDYNLWTNFFINNSVSLVQYVILLKKNKGSAFRAFTKGYKSLQGFITVTYLFDLCSSFLKMKLFILYPIEAFLFTIS